MFRTETQQIEDILQPIIESHNAYLIELAFKKSKFGHVVEVFIDTETGVTSELCVELSREFSSALELLEFLQGKYNLVVSSPGLERPLKYPKQYLKHKGHLMVLKHKAGESIVTSTGELTEVTESGVALILPNKETREFLFSEIIEAKVKPKW